MIPRDSLLTLEAYARERAASRPAMLAHRRLRSQRLGRWLNLQFEDERTVRYQIQEILRVERVFEEAGIQAEIEAYAPLLPDGGNWKATLLIEIPDADDRRRELPMLAGVQARVYVEVAGLPRVHAVPALAQPGEATRVAAVHFIAFNLPPEVRLAVQAGAPVVLGCDHPHETARVALPSELRASLTADLR